ncbi:MAG: DUF503 domain-containing protein [Chloroflexi bacterium]|nr:DUF503 domain-containing protein [Chloroflexota bacterium]
MAVGLCTIYLHIPDSHSLKDKRQVLTSLMARIRRDFNVSIAEVDQQDAWQAATLGIAGVSSEPAYVHGLLTKVVEAVSAYRLDAQVVDFHIEVL